MLRTGAAVLGISILIAGAPARAHDPFEITTDARVSGERLTLHTTMSLLTTTRACLRGPGALRIIRPEEAPSFLPVFEGCAREFYQVTAGGDPLPVTDARVTLTADNDVDMKVAYPRPRRSPLGFEALNLRPLVARVGILLTVRGERTFLGQELLRPDARRFEVPNTADAEAIGSAPLPSFRQYLALGIRHILTGYDHLLFLVGLLVACRRLRTVAGIVTCFTVAHSVTLALAALGLVNLSGRVVEPVIAATIVFVGVENLLRGEEPRGRWALAFGFGLVHGLGFATALREAGLGARGTSIVSPLVAFNLGVELGQLSVATVLLALFWALQRNPGFARRGRPVVSALVAGLGIVWVFERLAS
jgi:hydrogenase/urease accessory protein HupE